VSTSDLVLTAAIVTTLAAGGTARAIAKRRFEDRVLGRLPVGPDGLIPGAGPIDLASDDATAPAALLLHGFGDTPQTLRLLAGALHERGWSVRAPLLPGHGRTLKAWSATRGDEWVSYARSELATMMRGHETVALIGLSMGAAIAAALAADITAPAEAPRPAPPSAAAPSQSPGRSRLASLVLLAPYFSPPTSVRWAAVAHPIVALGAPYVSARGSVSILDPVERGRSLAYGATSPRLVAELARVARRGWDALPGITTPTLIIQSHADNRTLPAVAEGALARLAAADKRLVWLDQGGHVITVDHGHEAVASCVGEWVDAHAPSRARARQVRPA